MAGNIFISYRREDTAAYARLIFNELVEAFPRQEVFMDVDSIRPGEDFSEVIVHRLKSCSVLIVVIGRNWSKFAEQVAEASADDREDFVRIEIEAALKLKLLIIPVLVDGVPMPRSADLPKSLRPLARRTAIEVRHVHFAANCARLIDALSEALSNNKVSSDKRKPSDRSMPKHRFFGWGALETQRLAPTIIIFLLAIGISCFSYFAKMTIDFSTHLPSIVDNPAPAVSRPPNIAGRAEPGLAQAPSAPQTAKFIAEEVPFVSSKTRILLKDRYQSAAESKALAVNFSGIFGYAVSWSSEEIAQQEALRLCKENADASGSVLGCRVYAVGDRVIYEPPPTPPLPWILPSDPTVERPFAAREMPLIDDVAKARLERKYVPASENKSIAIGPYGEMVFIGGAENIEDSLRQTLQGCGAIDRVACIIIAVNSTFVVPVPRTFKVTGFYQDRVDRQGNPHARSVNPTSGWSAVAIGKRGRPIATYGALSEAIAIKDTLTNCEKEDGDCHIVAIGPFSVKSN
jgi:hypothetical protein